MMILKLALAIIQVLAKLIEWREQHHWINEGERRAYARQIKEVADALAKAARVEAEWSALTDAEVDRKLEENGWYRD